MPQSSSILRAAPSHPAEARHALPPLPPRMSPAVIVVATSKGGAGKTATASALAGVLPRAGLRVAYLDLDPDAFGSVMVMGLGVDAPAPLTDEPRPVMLRGVSGTLHVYAGGDRLNQATDDAVAAHITRVTAAADVVVVDTAPNLNLPATRAALRLASVVVTPIVPDYQALRGAANVVGALQSFGHDAHHLRILRARWEPTVVAAALEEDVARDFSGRVLTAVVPRDQHVVEASAAGRPCTLSRPHGRASTAYRLAAYEALAAAGLPLAPRSLV